MAKCYRERKAEKYRSHCNAFVEAHFERAFKVCRATGSFDCLNEVKRLLFAGRYQDLSEVFSRYESEAVDIEISLSECVHVQSQDIDTEVDVETSGGDFDDVSQCQDSTNLAPCDLNEVLSDDSSNVDQNDHISVGSDDVCDEDNVSEVVSASDSPLLVIHVRDETRIAEQCDLSECSRCTPWDDEPAFIPSICDVSVVVYAGPASGKSRLLRRCDYGRYVYDTDHCLDGLNSKCIVFTNQKHLLKFGELKVALLPTVAVQHERFLLKRKGRAFSAVCAKDFPDGTLILSTNKYLDEIVKWLRKW